MLLSMSKQVGLLPRFSRRQRDLVETTDGDGLAGFMPRRDETVPDASELVQYPVATGDCGFSRFRTKHSLVSS